MRFFLIVLLLLVTLPALAGEPAGVRLGNHDGYGRVVFDFPAPVSFTTERAGDKFVVRFADGGEIPSVAGSVRNVLEVTGGASVATVTVAPGARVRAVRLGARVVLDVLDAQPARPRTARLVPPPQVSPARQASAAPAAVVVEAPPTAAVAPAPAPVIVPVPAAAAAERVHDPAAMPIVQPAPRIPVARETTPAISAPAAAPAPLALAASRYAPTSGEAGGVLLPFDPTTAAAAFRHGAEGWVVFDERRALDLSDVRGEPVLDGAVVQLLESATLVRVKTPEGRALRLSRQPGGWLLAMADASSAAVPLTIESKAQRLLAPVAGAGRVVTAPDPESGQNLLVGTLRDAGPGVPAGHRAPEFVIRPSWRGLVVEPLSDRTQLRVVPEGFAIETGDALSQAPDAARALSEAAVLTRRFDLASEPAGSLLRRLQVQVADEARAAPQARLAPRLAAAQTMIALGLGAEAQSVLRLALAEDPRAAEVPELTGLTAVAALLSGRPDEADGLLDPALSGSDEVALWRAVREAMLHRASPEAAPVFAATIGLVLSYPAAIRSRLLPLAAETMAEGGATEAADALLAKLPNEPGLVFARATRLAAKGDAPGALTLYDAMANGRDRLASARSGARAALLRLDTGAAGPGETAKALERGFLAWRGDDRERDLRLRVSSLRAQAGQWRSAFDMLRETAPLYPDSAALIQARTAALLADMLRGPVAETASPLEWVALADENAEAIARADAAGVLADKLTALDLPGRAGPIIERMMAAAPAGADRARLGVRLAAMRLGEGVPDAARAALAASDAPDLPAELTEARGLLDARIHVAVHDVGGAAAILSQLGTAAADELRAGALGDAGDWRGSAAAMVSLVGRSVPAEGALTPAQQDLVIRLASAQARAGDEAALHALGAQQAARITGPRGDMFRLLTAAPISGVGDLKRSAGEVALARALPSGLTAFGSR